MTEDQATTYADREATGIPANGLADQGDLEPLGVPGLHHWRQAKIVEPSLEERGGIFFAAVEMTRMPMILTDPRQKDCPAGWRAELPWRWPSQARAPTAWSGSRRPTRQRMSTCRSKSYGFHRLHLLGDDATNHHVQVALLPENNSKLTTDLGAGSMHS